MSKTAGIERTRHDKLAKQLFRDKVDKLSLPDVWNDLSVKARDYYRAEAQVLIEQTHVLHENRHTNRAAVV